MNIFQNLTRWYFSKRALPFWAILLLDALIVVAAVVLVVVLTDGAVNTLMQRKSLALAAMIYLLCRQ